MNTASQADPILRQCANHVVGGILWADVTKEQYNDLPDARRRVTFAFDEFTAIRLRRVLRLLGLENVLPADDVELMGSLFPLLGTIAARVQRLLPPEGMPEATEVDTPFPSDDPVELHAEIFRLRAELQGPTGFKTWKDAAVAEKMRRVEAEAKLDDLLKRSEPADAKLMYQYTLREFFEKLTWDETERARAYIIARMAVDEGLGQASVADICTAIAAQPDLKNLAAHILLQTRQLTTKTAGAIGLEPAGVIEVDNVYGWHMRALQPWVEIGQGTKLFKLP